MIIMTVIRLQLAWILAPWSIKYFDISKQLDDIDITAVLPIYSNQNTNNRNNKHNIILAIRKFLAAFTSAPYSTR